MATDVTKKLPHQPRNVQELAGAAHEVWQAHNTSPSNEEWQLAAMDKLGAALSLFALGPSDPRHAPPAANVQVKLP